MDFSTPLIPSQGPLWEGQLLHLPALAPPLLGWYDSSARQLPFRSNPTPYRVWVSEIMLQQTRVEAALPYYTRFLEALPDEKALAAAPEDVLLKLWEGLGYYSRARNLQKAARLVVERHGGRLPGTYKELLELPGIGAYTAGAIASIAFGQAVPAVDGNVLRVLSRILGCSDDVLRPQVKVAFEKALLAAMPQDRPGDYNQALMELGATVCLPNAAPLCSQCPVADQCWAKASGNPTALPVKAAGRPRRHQTLTVLVALCQGRVLLHRRPKTGLLAGLWELPNWEGPADRAQCLAKLEEWGCPKATLSALAPGKHIFTHVEWHMEGLLTRCDPFPAPAGCAWATLEELQDSYTLPSAFACYVGELTAYL